MKDFLTTVRSRLSGWLPIVILAAIAPPALAQRARVVAPDQVSVGEEVNLFAEVGPDFQGAVLALPVSWTFVDAAVYDEDGVATTLVGRSATDVPGRFRLLSDGMLRDASTVRIRVRVGDLPADARWTLTPLERQVGRGTIRLVPRDSERITRSLRVEDGVPSGSNRVLVLDGSGPVELDARRLPDLGTGSAWTVETWFRTTTLEVPLFSTWDGRDRSDYPVEAVIEGTGRLAVFQGLAGRHRSLRTRGAVADGGWHHVAVMHDPVRGWTRLLVDGVAEDSLYGFDFSGIPAPNRLALGGRPAGSVDREQRRFRGELDEFRVWAVARTPMVVRAGMARSFPQPATGAVVIGFDAPVDPAYLVGRRTRLPTRLSNRSSGRRFGALDVRPGHGTVELSWSGEASGRYRYEVERSSDGSRYETVATYQSGDGVPDALAEVRVFRHSDRVPDGRIAFYRIRAVAPDGGERLSSAVKVGVGEAAEHLPARIEGAYPNPFNPATTISYRVDEAVEVSVSVWDLAGQRVRALADGPHQPGLYTVPFVAGDLPSGTYFVRLRTPAGVHSHQIVLAK